MTPKEYLWRYRDLNGHIDSKLDEIAHLRDIATRLSPTAMFTNNGDITDKVGRTAAKIVDLQREIDAEIDDIINRHRAARQAESAHVSRPWSHYAALSCGTSPTATITTSAA